MGKCECKSEIYMTTNLTVATASGKWELHFVSCFAAKQTAENEKRFYDLRFCGLLQGNKQTLLWMSQQTQEIYRWLPPGRIWWDSSSIDVLAWYWILSLDLLCDHFWHDFLLQYCLRSIPLFCVYARRRLYSKLYDMLPSHSSIQRASQYYNTPLVVSWRMCASIIMIHLNLIVSRESIHEIHSFKPTRVADHDICD